MTADRRPAEAYVHGPVVVVSGRMCDWFLRHTDMAKVRVAQRGLDPEVDAVLNAITYQGQAHRTCASASTGATALADPPQVPSALSERLGTTAAADLLNITEQAVRLAIKKKRLPAEKVDDRWQITRHDVERYRAARAA